ncbi:hypothetical protein AUK57_00760 [Candidatus Saccharibacteria bacterium CG2_30_41_52]|nr:MAG: hypothetical protein AUK57_00760 [Candidatus Saccharibacteria bacterium CG2_30_41_52]
MEVAIIIVVVLIITILAKTGSHAKAREQSNNLSKNEKDIALDEHQRKQQEIDELITVVLPTIKNDK